MTTPNTEDIMKKYCNRCKSLIGEYTWKTYNDLDYYMFTFYNPETETTEDWDVCKKCQDEIVKTILSN